MKLFTGLHDIPADFGPSVVAIGKFDGVHLGHVAMIARARDIADQRGLVSTVVTFDRHPRSVIDPKFAPVDITGMERRVDLIEATGADVTLVLPFTEDLARLEPQQFVREILINRLHAEAVVVGSDFRFGHDAVGTTDMLTELGHEMGFDVVVMDDVLLDGDRRVSSSWVREALAEGDCPQATRLLNRHHAIRGEVVHGEARGREMGYPTANMSQASSGLIPADGVYAGYLIDEDGTRYGAGISVGTNPTFQGIRNRVVEAHCFDQKLDLYGHIVIIEFVQRLRGMVAFDGVDALVAQMNADEVQIREILGLPAKKVTT